MVVVNYGSDCRPLKSIDRKTILSFARVRQNYCAILNITKCHSFGKNLCKVLEMSKIDYDIRILGNIILALVLCMRCPAKVQSAVFMSFSDFRHTFK